jgi:glycosyltransferase involved in cell wall biosynthesis
MRVAHIPVNIASQASSTVLALRDQGVDAQGWEFGRQKPLMSDGRGLTFVHLHRRGEYRTALSAAYRFARILTWAEIVHWYSVAPTFLPIDLARQSLQRIQRPGVVEWCGSDIRLPAVELSDNPIFRTHWEEHADELAPHADLDRSMHRQEFFAELGFDVVVAPGMLQYVLPDLLNRTHVVHRGIPLERYVPRFPESGNEAPVVAHAPSKQTIKGSTYVVDAVKRLQCDATLGFDLISGVQHAEALARIASCDVYIDQMILGDYGVAAIEAMALGKPVVCYMKPSVLDVYPPDLPIVNATPHTLSGVLEELLNDGDMRANLGRRGREYAERNHNVLDRALALKKVYASLY